MGLARVLRGGHSAFILDLGVLLSGAGLTFFGGHSVATGFDTLDMETGVVLAAGAFEKSSLFLLVDFLLNGVICKYIHERPIQVSKSTPW